MKKSNVLFLAAIALGLLGITATGISFNNSDNSYHEVIATDNHSHDSVNFDIALNQANFASTTLTTGNYYLTGDITLSEIVTKTIDNSHVKLCLNGHYIKNTNTSTGDWNKPLFDIINNGSLTLYDCNNETHKYSMVQRGTTADQAVAVVNDSLTSGYETFKGGYITGYTDRGVAYITNGVLTIRGGTIIGNQYYHQFLLYDNATMNIEKGSFIGNYDGENSSHSMHSLITGNGSNNLININAASDDDVLFYKNYSDSYGGAIRGYDGCDIAIHHATFSNNRTMYCGGAIEAEGDFRLNGAKFIHNVAGSSNVVGYGGAIRIDRESYSDAEHEIEISNATFDGNQALGFGDDGGGAIEFRLHKNATASDEFNIAHISNCTFTNGYSNNGGAILWRDSTEYGSFSKLYLDNCTFTDNIADYSYPENGGAISASSNSGSDMLISLNGCTLTDNHASYGGAIAIETQQYGSVECGDTTLNLKGTTIAGNSAIELGGALYFDCDDTSSHNKVVIDDNTSIVNNCSEGSAGGILAAKCELELKGLVTIKNNYVVENKVPSNIYFPGELETASSADDPAYITNLALKPGSSIGISMKDIGDFSKNLTADTSKNSLKYFFSDDTNYSVAVNGTTNQLCITNTPTPPTPPTPTPTPDPDPVYNKDGVEIFFEDGTELPSDVTIRVEVRAEVKEASSEVDYSKIKAKLNNNEHISKVYDVKLIKTEGGVETEIQPSDIKEGLKLKVKITLPDDVSTKGLKLLHIHSVDDMEFINIDNMEGRELTFEVSKLSQFAFINSVSTGLPGWAIALIIIAVLLLLLCVAYILLFFVFNKYIITAHKDIARVFVIKKHQNDVTMLDMYLRRVYRKDVDVYDTKDAAENYLKKQK